MPHWHLRTAMIQSSCLQRTQRQLLHWPMPSRCVSRGTVLSRIAALNIRRQDIGAVAHVRCGAADIDVEPRTAAAMSLHQLTQLVPGNAKYAEGLARCIARMPDIHGRVRWPVRPAATRIERCRAEHGIAYWTGAAGGEYARPLPAHQAGARCEAPGIQARSSEIRRLFRMDVAAHRDALPRHGAECN